MTVKLTISIPDDVMASLIAAADRDYRTPEGQLQSMLADWMAGARWAPNADAARQLTAELGKLHAAAGSLSLRTIAARTAVAGTRVSHTTVHEALHGVRVPGWAKLEAIVRMLDGDGSGSTSCSRALFTRESNRVV